MEWNPEKIAHTIIHDSDDELNKRKTAKLISLNIPYITDLTVSLFLKAIKVLSAVPRGTFVR